MIRTSLKFTRQSCIDKPIGREVKFHSCLNSYECRLIVKSKFQNSKSFSNLTNSITCNIHNNSTRINYNKHLRCSNGLNKKSNTEHVIVENQDNSKLFHKQHKFSSEFNNTSKISPLSYNDFKFKTIKNNFILNQINNFKLKPYREKRSVSYLLKTKEIESYTDMMNPTINYFAHSFIDRCSDRRKDQKWIDEQMKSDKAVFVLFHIDKVYLYICICSNVWNRMFILFISLF